ncbi:MAG: DUF177 domain-containing protein [Helicobacteraceae bacterium]|nr:DUF177 domain-containing protein [Helicobacteraceae bacterium]
MKVQIDGATLEGELSAGKSNLTRLSGRLSGKIRLNCDICLSVYERDLDENIEALISDGVYKGDGEEVSEAVIEQSGFIDLEEILRGEIASIECDYHRCDSCQKR